MIPNIFFPSNSKEAYFYSTRSTAQNFAMSESSGVPKISEKRDCQNGLYLLQLHVLFVLVGHAALFLLLKTYIFHHELWWSFNMFYRTKSFAILKQMNWWKSLKRRLWRRWLQIRAVTRTKLKKYTVQFYVQVLLFKNLGLVVVV